MVALVLRDLANKLQPVLRGQSVIFDLTGSAGGRFRLGKLTEPSAILKMDLLEFNRLASERISAEDVRANGLVTISGDHSFADQVLSQTTVPY
jgi:hypothetical protein